MNSVEDRVHAAISAAADLAAREIRTAPSLRLPSEPAAGARRYAPRRWIRWAAPLTAAAAVVALAISLVLIKGAQNDRVVPSKPVASTRPGDVPRHHVPLASPGPTSSPGKVGQSPVPTPPAPTPPASTSSASPGESTGIQNLLVSSAVRSQLIAAYVAMRQIPAPDVSGTEPNGVYYAYDPATNTYWALAHFTPTQGDPLSVQYGFQDGGDIGMFTKIGSGPWSVQSGGMPAVCIESRFFPKAVLTSWEISAAGYGC